MAERGARRSQNRETPAINDSVLGAGLVARLIGLMLPLVANMPLWAIIVYNRKWRRIKRALVGKRPRHEQLQMANGNG